MKIAKRNKGKPKEFSIPKRIAIEISMSELEYKKLCIGRVSQSMDEKWDDFVENNLLTCYRSWTGNPIFQAKIIRNANNEYQINEFIGETDNERIKLNSDEELKSMFRSHISYLINR